MENAIVNVQGTFLNRPDEGIIPVFDRSYLYGDSLYEVARTYSGQLFQMKGHLERLEQSARLCKMTLSQTTAFIEAECIRSVEKFYQKKENRHFEAYCRVIISRGHGKIGFGLENLQSPTQFTIIVQPLNAPTKSQWEKGFHYALVDRPRNHPRALAPAMKSGNYLNNLLGHLEARESGAEDALFCDLEGFLTEGSTFNLFYIRNGIVVTSPLEVGILDGITRKITLRAAEKIGLETRITRYPPGRLFEADEVFMTSTIKEVFPVTQIDGKKLGSGKTRGLPGPWTRKLLAAFQAEVCKELGFEKLDPRFQ
jgi:branched-chain amino acid aminotransferase